MCAVCRKRWGAYTCVLVDCLAWKRDHGSTNEQLIGLEVFL